MSETPSNKATGWIGQAVQALVIIVTTWQLFAKEIHGYIDNELEDAKKEIVKQVSAVGHGQMLLVADSMRADMQLYQDSTNARFTRLENAVSARPLNRTVINPPDSAGLQELKRRMLQIEQGVEAILDGQATAERRSRLKRTSQSQD